MDEQSTRNTYTEIYKPICAVCKRLYNEERTADIYFESSFGTKIYFCAEHGFDSMKDLPESSEMLKRFKEIEDE